MATMLAITQQWLFMMRNNRGQTGLLHSDLYPGLYYNPCLGKIYRNYFQYKMKEVGQKDGRLSYRQKRLGFNRVAFEIFFDRKIKEGHVIDHIDGNNLNNKIDNLREVTQRVNTKNRGYHRNGKLPGVGYHKLKQKWQAYISVDGKDIHLGYYLTKKEAYERYLKECNKRGYI